jgi:3-methylcrotonyl-CoA carboxylase alpha subunit
LFDRILIANRGEIACRIARTAKYIGVETVAIYSEPDSQAQHVHQCDQSVPLGGTTASDTYLDIEKVIGAASDTYLDIEKVIGAAIETGADAIHPGYGFLSENPDFAHRCRDSGIIFIGPSPESISIMGVKSVARKTVQSAGVPVLPGYDGDNQDPGQLVDAAAAIGYPVMIKAVSGGGGKGIRTVHTESDFASALESVKRESRSAFNDDRVMLEKYLPVTRHIEIQVFADSHANVVHLFERDCSLQRRHQKVIEEAPAPGIGNELREAMATAAMECARTIDYLGAGTVEFLLAPDNTFYFMEMNTRLQVEHPVTEMVTGLDLVEWQMRVAAGEELPLDQSQLSLRGHAMEARIYAENPEQGFLPSTGTMHFVQQPATDSNVRIDTGFVSGDKITMHYDPMISKLVTWGSDRTEALKRMRAALAGYQILGLWNNIPFLTWLAGSKSVIEGSYDTGTIERLQQTMADDRISTTYDAATIAACYEILRNRKRTLRRQRVLADPWSPWSLANGSASGEICLEFESGNGAMRLVSGGEPADIDACLLDNNRIVVTMAGCSNRATVAHSGNEIFVYTHGHNHILTRIDRRSPGNIVDLDSGTLLAPMPGSIVSIPVNENDVVEKGTLLMTMEAMKMEHQIKAPADGTVTAINFKTGDQVHEGDALLVLES